MRRVLILLAIICVTLVLFSNLAQPMSPDDTGEISALAEIYSPHNKILIVNDTDFEAQGWPGTGSVEHPYLIEGLSFNIPKGNHCIEIRNTRKYFTVRDCFFNHTGDAWDGGTDASTGIKLFNNTHGLIEKNRFVEDGAGVNIILTNNTQILDNVFTNTADDPIYSAVSSNITIKNNICGGKSFSIGVANSGYDYSPTLKIIELYSGNYDNVTITDNVCNASRLGILIAGCLSGLIENNTAFGNDAYWDAGQPGSETRGSNFVIQDSKNICFLSNIGVAKGVSISIKNSYSIVVNMSSFTSTEFRPVYTESSTTIFDYNFYSNYGGIDEDEDGIGDTAYLDLYGSIQDNHPLMYYPWFPPIPASTTSTTTSTSTSTTTSATTPISPDSFQFQLMMMYGLGLSTGIIVLVIVVIFLKKNQST